MFVKPLQRKHQDKIESSLTELGTIKEVLQAQLQVVEKASWNLQDKYQPPGLLDYLRLQELITLVRRHFIEKRIRAVGEMELISEALAKQVSLPFS